MITLDQLRQIIPLGGHRCDTFLAPINMAMDRWEINTPLREAAFLAQVAHESGSLRWVEELASGKAYDGRADLGNNLARALAIAAGHGTTPGPFYKGRGLIQITGYDNYRACSSALFDDPDHLTLQPELLTLPDLAASSAGWFWAVHGCNELADADNIRKITRKINGGYNGLEERVEYYIRAKQVLGA